MLKLHHAKLITAGEIAPCDLLVHRGKIERFGPPGSLDAALPSDLTFDDVTLSELQAHPERLTDDTPLSLDAEGLYLSHGFLDTHVHGGGGHDFMDGTVEAWDGARALHMRHGTTGIVPTTLSSAADELLDVITFYAEHKDAMSPDGARILGLHLEGPYLSPAQSGAQDPARLRDPSPDEYGAILDHAEDILKWSVAPERPGALDMADALVRRGIVPCIAHSDAIADEVRAAVRHGYRIVTHLYSGCSTITRQGGFRYAGVVEAAYLLDALSSELIADGCHLPADLLQMAYRFIGPDRLILVTDAMRAAGQTEGESILGSLTSGQRVILEDGVAKMPDRTAFAGSIATTDRLVRTMYRLTDATLPECIRMITETPARRLGLDHRYGLVAPGRPADLVLFDDAITVRMTMVDGIIRHLAD